MLTRNRTLLLLLFLLASSLVPAAAEAQRRGGGAPLVVTEAVATAAIIEEVPLAGTVTSPRVSSISSEVSGLVSKVLVEVGAVVAAGEVLVALNPELGELEYQALAAAAARAQEELADAARRLRDARQLARRDTISENELQSLQAEVNMATAAARRAQAEQALQQARLARHTIKAPFQGVITKTMVNIGQWVQPGAPVAQLVARDNLRVDFQLPQRIYPRVNSDTRIEIRLDALPGVSLPGRIDTVVPFSEAGARTMLIRATLEQANPAIVPGMSAAAVLRLQRDGAGTVVSRDAVVRYPDGRVTAWVVRRQDGNGDSTTVEERHILIGLAFDGMVEVLEGLSPGELVVIEGNESLRNNQAVRVAGG